MVSARGPLGCGRTRPSACLTQPCQEETVHAAAFRPVIRTKTQGSVRGPPVRRYAFKIKALDRQGGVTLQRCSDLGFALFGLGNASKLGEKLWGGVVCVV